MKAAFFVATSLIVFATDFSTVYAQRAVLLVRHADRLDASEDTPLWTAGEARAQLLARLLKDAGVTAIYTSQFQRTIKTAEPLANSLKIKPVNIATRDNAGLFKRVEPTIAMISS